MAGAPGAGGTGGGSEGARGVGTPGGSGAGAEGRATDPEGRPDRGPDPNADPDADPDADGGEAFGSYRLLSLIGRGGMGEVWRAYDTRRERTVALKRLAAVWAGDPELDSRFRREARATARLSSAHVIPIHDFGEIDERLFVDMRLVEGGDLSATLADHPHGLPPERAVEILSQVGEALASAHAVGLVHRDVKPSNILLSAGESRDFCYLVDFGIAKAIEDAASAMLTRTGAVLGTPAYMAPELFTGASSAGVASDVYALGCVLHEMLTGHRPFPGRDMPTLMHHHLTSPPPRPSGSRPELAAFDDLVARALAKDPAQRPASVTALGAAARAALGAGERYPATPSRRPASPAFAAPPPPPYPGPPPGSSAAASMGTPRPPAATGSPGPPPRPLPAWSPAPVGPAVHPGAQGPTARHPWWRRWWAISLVAVLVLGAAVVGGILLRSGRTTSTTAPPAASAPSTAAAAPLRLTVRDGGVPTAATGLVLTGDGRRLFAAVPGSDQSPGTQLTVSAVDPLSGAVTTGSAATVGAHPQDVVVSPDGRRAYVTCPGTTAAPLSTVAVVDTATAAVVATVPVADAPGGIAISPDGRRVYSANPGQSLIGSTVSVIDTASLAVVATVPVASGPGRIVVSPDGRSVYVSGYGSPGRSGNTVSVIDGVTDTVSATVPVNSSPLGMTLSPDGATLFIAGNGAADEPRGSIAAIDLRQGYARRSVPDAAASGAVADPSDVAVTPDGAHLVVTNPGSSDARRNSVLVLDAVTGALQGELPVPSPPFAVAMAPDGRNAYVTTQDGLQIIGLV